MIALFTDFGLDGPYTGQVKAVLADMAPGIPVVDLFADAPAGDPKASAYLLATYAAWFPKRTIFLSVVDPGVGGPRPALFLEADGRWYVGPGNGLFELVQRRARETRCFEIDWRPERLSASFHGRDLFAPFAAMLARGETPPAGGMWAPAMGCLSSFSVARARRCALRSIGGRSASRPVFTAATSSRPLPRCWPAETRRRADHARTLVAARTGPTNFRRLLTSIITATP